MTDAANTSTTDEVEEPTSDEAKTLDLRSVLNIDPNTSPLAELLKLYRSNVKIVTDYTASKAKEDADPKDPSTIVKNNIERAIKSPEMSALITELSAKYFEPVGELVFSEDHNLFSAAVLLRQMETLTALVKSEFNFHFMNAVQNQKDRDGIKISPNESAMEARLICESLSDLIRKRTTIEELTAELEGRSPNLPKNLRTSGGKRGGFNTEVFPRIPKLDMGDAAPRSGATTKHLEFTFTPAEAGAEEVSFTGSLRQVAHDVCSVGAVRISGDMLAELLKKNGHGMGISGERWELELPTGVLSGKAVADGE